MDKNTQAFEVNELPLANRNARIEVSSIRLKETISKYWNYKFLFVFSVVTFLFFTYVFLYFKTPIYTSSIKILLKYSNGGYSGGGKSGTSDLGLGFFSNRPNLANEVEIIKAVSLIERVVEKNNLNTEIYFLGRARNLEIYDKANPSIIEFQNIKDSSKVHSVRIGTIGNKIYYLKGGKIVYINNFQTVSLEDGADFKVNFNLVTPSKVKNEYYCTWYPTKKIASNIAGGISSNALNKEATILTLSYSYPLPQKGKDILNALAGEYSLQNIESKNQTIDNTLQFIDDRLSIIGKDLGSVESDMLKFKLANNALDLKTQLSAGMGKSENLKTQIGELTVKMQVCDMLSDYVNNPRRKFNLIPSNLGIEDLTLTRFVGAYNDDVSKRELLLKTLPEGNIEVRKTESEIEQIRIKILESIRNVKAEFHNSYTFNDRLLYNVSSEVRDIPRKEKELLDIERQQQIKERLYLYLLEKREEAAISKASAVSNSNSLDEAVSSGPIGASNSVIYSLSIILGFAFPIMIIFIKELLNDKIITRKDIEEISSIPIIGDIGHQTNVGREILQNSRGRVAEQLRLLITNFQYFINQKIPSKILLVTSTVKGEGKSFISMNLANAIARSGKKTLVMEFDLRRPRISKSLGIPNEIGLSNFLSGGHEIKDLIKSVEGVDNLFLISSGVVPPNPAELLMSDEKLQDMFSHLKETYEYIIIDTAPLGLVSDAKLLSKYSDLNLYIVRHRYTLKSHIAFVDSLYSNKILPNIALVVNDAVTKGVSSYYSGYGAGSYLYGGYYGYSYGYGYSYNYGYSSDKEGEKKETFISRIKGIFKLS